MSAYNDIDLHEIARQAMQRYGFECQFFKNVIQEVDRLDPAKVLEGRRGGRVDLRSLLWSSIDNVDSLDLDQLEYAEAGPDGEIRIKVAIADVDLFVPRGSEADRYAAHNATSVYTGIEIFPMLPPRLSTDLTSLKAGEDRAAIVIEFDVLKNGDVRRGQIYPALVCNRAKLVYEEVGAWLDGKGPAPQAFADIPGLEAQVRMQDEAAGRLRSFRMEQGALELESLEARTVMKDETVVGLVLPSEDRAHHLIENFMIVANGTVMSFLEKARVPVIQRIVRIPKNWPGIVDVAAEFGVRLPFAPDVKALSKFLLKRKSADPDHFPDLSLTIVKLLGPGEYMMLEPGKPPVGHFGLAVADYTHSTAPNRRYVDVIIQRLLKAVLEKRPCPYSRKELIEHAAWCTDRDKMSKKVERFMQKVAAAVLMKGRIGEIFDGIITGASDKGIYVRLVEPPVEGRIMGGGLSVSVGEKVRVKLTDLDPYQGHIDFQRAREDLISKGRKRR
jgi:VacB/RNase II family 3'-5' exoribonuclease